MPTPSLLHPPRPDHPTGLVLAGPTCVGKSEHAAALMARIPMLARPITTTTRPARSDEQDGRDYHFVTPAAFASALAAGELLAPATVHGAQYGCTRAAYAAVVDSGRTPLLVLDVQGVEALQSQISLITVFLTAPFAAIRRRLAAVRPPDQVERRLQSAAQEMMQITRFHYVVSNDDGARASAERSLDHIVATHFPQLIPADEYRAAASAHTREAVPGVPRASLTRSVAR